MPKRSDERFAYGSILEALSRGLYPDKRHVLREFVQNAYDSLFELKKKHPKESLGPVRVKIQRPSIFIADYGSGMSRSEVQQYRYLGFSQKQRGKHAGFRGIGKYSGISLAEKIIVDTSPLGVPKHYRIVIHADRMMSEVDLGKNPPLEDILRRHTEFQQTNASREEHFTFVELHNLSNEAAVLFDVDNVKNYLARTAPVPFDPKFKYGRQVQQKMRDNIPDFLAIDLKVNGSPVYKQYFGNCREPEFETILYRDDEESVLAHCWYCQNIEKGQFEPKDLAGLSFRVKNISVGDGQLSRQMLWERTPERAFYFFGEIHILDSGVIPSSDRTAFEDNAARTRLEDRCVRIASNLNRKAGEESAMRRFDQVLDRSLEVIARREKQAKSGQLPVELEDEVVYEFRKIEEDVRKRLKGPKTSKAVNRAKRLMGRTRGLLQTLKKNPEVFLDLKAELQFDSRLRALYDCVVQVLKEEFSDDPGRLEGAIERIHEYARAKLQTK